ncbi:MAG: ATP-binding protein [Gammaproteobacteria bacterium]|nr:ATP-binding protein [Gammaproteobacteria bacterium]
MNKSLLALYGLKWNPFSPELPTEALMATPALEDFAWRIEHTHVREGGFALITGAPGTGKSVALRILAARLGRLPDLTIAALTHPSANLADFYRELGDLFGVDLKPHNRWMGFKGLRTRWLATLDASLMRPVLLIDEAQEIAPVVLNELRLLASSQFDSRTLLSVVLAGDQRLTDLLRRDDLLPLGSRIRARLALEHASRDHLLACLEHLCTSAGNPGLFSEQLAQALADHAMGNYRVLTNMAAEILAHASRHELTQLDEKLFFDVFHTERKPSPRRARSAA